ncbi:MAG: DNA helicase IV [Vibrio sp.]
MQLSASRIARFFIQNEYQQVEVKDQSIVLSTRSDEIQIPFSTWNGEVTVERGLFWGNLYFHSYEDEDEEQIRWLAQGLPMRDCQDFARYAIAEYRRWQLNRSETLAQYLPSWLKQLQELINQPDYFTHSSLMLWLKGISDDLAKKDMTLDEVIHLFPGGHESNEEDDQFDFHAPTVMTVLKRWLTHPEESLAQRNRTWLNNEEQDWQDYFKECERSPLNESQQKAVLLNDDHSLILAGAGSGKTSVLMAKVGYLLKSGQANPEDILMVSFGRDASQEMQQRIEAKFGEDGKGIKVQTFHQLGLNIIKAVEGPQVDISSLATDPTKKMAWLSNWLKMYWDSPANFNRWKKHLMEWPIAYLKGDVDLRAQTENPKLLAWLEFQVEVLSSMQMPKKQIQERLVHLDDYPQLNSELMLAWPCYQAWQKMLKAENQIDFTSMIIKAAQYAKNGKFKSQWKYILVDEYQDISPNRLDLLNNLCHNSAHKLELGETTTQKPCALFAVGDDWQAIYRFAGADVNLTTGFKERFPHAQIHHLDTTYRFNNQIGDVANRFIQANPHQLEKTLNSHKHVKQKMVIVAPMSSLERILSDLNAQDKKRKKVMILGRNHYHEPTDLKTLQKLNLHLDIEFKTCHSSKGKEADYVIIVSVDDGQFPPLERQKHLHDVLLSQADAFPHAEERRLFYVAMTRAKEKVWILHNANPSVFVRELKQGRYPINVKKR